MSDNLRARASHQALAVPVEPVSRLDPSGFDPSRVFAISLLHSAWIGELELSVRAWTVFEREGVLGVAYIENATDRELLALSGFGRQTLRDTREAVNRFRERWHKHGTPFTLASAIEARRAAATKIDAVHESAVAKPDAQTGSGDS